MPPSPKRPPSPRPDPVETYLQAEADAAARARGWPPYAIGLLPDGKQWRVAVLTVDADGHAAVESLGPVVPFGLAAIQLESAGWELQMRLRRERGL